MKHILFSTALLLGLNAAAQQTTKFPLQPDMSRSQVTRWLQKPVSDSLMIDDFESNRYEWYNCGIGTISVVSDNSRDGRHALRYRTSMRDSLHISSPSERSPWGSFGGQQGGENSFGIRFQQPQDWSRYNRISIWVYVHPDRNKHHHFFLYVENEGTDYSYPLEPRHDHCVQNLREGEWQQIVWEIDYLDRSRIREFRIFQTLVCYEPSGDQYVTFDFDRLQLQRVAPDHYDGYQLLQGQVGYSHIGYRPQDEKIALAAAVPFVAMLSQQTGQVPTVFTLIDSTGREVFSAPAKPVSNRNGRFVQLDFSPFTAPGIYRLRYGDAESELFPIGDDVWQVPFTAGLNYYYCQQCGVAVEGYHDVCHNDWFGFKGTPGTADCEKKPMNGGFHDAGDLSQGYFRTALAGYILLRSQASEPLARHAVDWMMKTRFTDGHHISWARQRTWTDNREGTIDDVMIRASAPAWENFLGAAVLAMAAQKHVHASSVYCDSIAAAAIDNWQHAYTAITHRADGVSVVSDNEAAWGAIGSVALWRLTGEQKYKDTARALGRLLVGCQERRFILGTNITGYFYTDNRRERIVQNNHGAFYESPIVALRTLCDAFPDDEDWMSWYASAAIYADCFLKPGAKWAAPFDLLPNAVYRRSDLENVRGEKVRRSALEQYRQGWQLADGDYCLRTFPVWGGDIFHGATCCNLSTTWGLMEASQLRNDRQGLNLAKEQLEWTLGRNPFGQSLMYGVGYNWATQFVYCSKDMVGGLPVGMDSFKDDAPYWHGSNYATSKETWIGTVNRFMGALTTFLQPASQKADASVSTERLSGGSYRLAIHVAKGRHTVTVKCVGGKATLSFTAFSGTKASPVLTITPFTTRQPAVAVVFIDGKPLCDVVI